MSTKRTLKLEIDTPAQYRVLRGALLTEEKYLESYNWKPEDAEDSKISKRHLADLATLKTLLRRLLKAYENMKYNTAYEAASDPS